MLSTPLTRHSSGDMATSTPFCSFTERLPAEVRNQVYENVLCFNSSIREQDDELGNAKPPADVSLLFVNKQIYLEALPIFLQKNTFSLLCSHACAKDPCLFRHACKCGVTKWPDTSLDYRRLKKVEQLEIRLSKERKEWAPCGSCFDGDATCYEGVPKMLEDIVLLPKLRTFTILCESLQDFIRGHNGLKYFAKRTDSPVTGKITSTQIGKNEVIIGGKHIVLRCPKFTAGWMSAHMQVLQSTGAYAFRHVETCYRIDSILLQLKVQSNFGRETATSLLHYFKMDEDHGINKLQLKNRPNPGKTLAKFNMALATVLRQFQRARYEFIEYAELDALMVQPMGERWDFAQGLQDDANGVETIQEFLDKYPDSDKDRLIGEGDEDVDNRRENDDDSDDNDMGVNSSDEEEDLDEVVEA